MPAGTPCTRSSTCVCVCVCAFARARRREAHTLSCAHAARSCCIALASGNLMQNDRYRRSYDTTSLSLLSPLRHSVYSYELFFLICVAILLSCSGGVELPFSTARETVVPVVFGAQRTKEPAAAERKGRDRERDRAASKERRTEPAAYCLAASTLTDTRTQARCGGVGALDAWVPCSVRPPSATGGIAHGLPAASTTRTTVQHDTACNAAKTATKESANPPNAHRSERQ